MSEGLKVAAVRAVADAKASGGGSLRIRAVKLLRGQRRGWQMRDCLDAVTWAIARSRPTLTREAKQQAVEEMAQRLAAAACDYNRAPLPDAYRHARILRWRRAALVRVAMAATVD